jgi:hypothetical protein
VTVADGIDKTAIVYSKIDTVLPSTVPFELAVSGMCQFTIFLIRNEL